MSSEDLAAYVQTVRTLWPEGPEPRLARRGAPSSGRPGWLVVPNAEQPRMLVPEQPAAAAGAMMRFSSALGVRERVKRIGVGAAMRVSRGRLLRSRLEAGSADGSLLEELSGTLSDTAGATGGGLVCSLTLGTARANRKPVLQLFTDRGEQLAFAKVGVTERAKGDVRTEHQNLLTLQDAGLPDSLEVPRVLAFLEWRGMPTLVMTQLRTPALERRLTGPAEVRSVMDDFARHFDGGTVPLPEVPQWKTLTTGLDDIRDEESRVALHAAMERLAEQTGGTGIPVGAWHGDWAPWNMARARGRLQLWDWERFSLGVPVGFDRCHFGINTALVERGVTVASVRHGLALGGFASPGPGTVDHAVAGLYLVTILHRYLHGDEDPPAQVRERVAVLREVLATWVAAR